MTQVSVESVRNVVEVQTGATTVDVTQNTIIVTAGAQQGPRGPAGNVEGAISGYTVTAGDGLSGGGSITSNVTIDVDSSVVRSTGQQTVGSILYVDEANSRVGINQSDPKIALHIGAVGLGTYSLTTSSTIPNQIADQWSASDFRSAKYQVQVYSNSSNEYEISEIFIVHDDSNVFLTEYAIVNQGTRLAQFDASIFSGTVRLLCSPTYAINDIKVFRTVINT